MKYFVIEHPSRGWFLDWCWSDGKPKFAWSIHARDKRVMRFYDLQSARKMIDKMGPRIGDRCVIKELKPR